MTPYQQRRMFQSAAVFNWLACLILLPGTGIAAQLGFTPLMDSGPFEHMALMVIALFGYGYWMVSRDPVTHRGIIVLGIIGKLGVVAVMFGHYFFGPDMNLRQASLALVDLAYAVIFFRTLKSMAHQDSRQ
jgi:hypothetical protein